MASIKKRILVVEDAIDLREEFVDYLRFCGFEAEGVGSVAGLVRRLETEPWHVVILDLGLPDGDGIAAARRIREQRGLGLGIIIVTARGQAEDRIAGARAGADAYLIKPVDLRELIAVIGHLLQRLEAAQPPSPPMCWTLEAEHQTLLSPEGVEVQLTGAEYLLLSKLIANPGNAVTRTELCAELAPGGDPEDTRRLDSLISRLRAKVLKQTGSALPIRAFRNLGYLFSGTVRP